ncbi:MAG: hypothetical protein ACRDCE_08530 [Cetobacterium sp.]|uniref:hypothetical protein n=1 Tax=Cetobacterium sp. TaxID=2071632 RepID=UPI003EE52E30
MTCEYNQNTLTCFFRNTGYRFKNCPFGYLRKNNLNILRFANDCKKYFNDEKYNAFTGILKPNLKRDEYVNIYNFFKSIIEINEQLKNILEIYNKILKKEDITEELRAILIDITLDQLSEEIKGNLEKSEKFQQLSEMDRVIALISIDGTIYVIKNKTGIL